MAESQSINGGKTSSYQTMKVHVHEGHHHGISNEHSSQDGTFKAAVFGFSDGLCTNVNVILAMFAAVSSGNALTSSDMFSETRHIICLTGLCGLLGGASSMACGEWLSATAENQANKHELKTEKWHHRAIPEKEAEDMHSLMKGAGLSEETCCSIDSDLAKMSVEDRFQFHAKFELGIEDEDETLGGSLKNAAFMWMSFAVGAFIPLFPWLFAPESVSLNALFFLTLVATTFAMLATAVFQAHSITKEVFTMLSLTTFIKQSIVVVLAIGVTVGLNVLLTGSMAGGPA